MSRFSSALVAAALLTAACSEPVDKAAKERIFSPEDPPKVISAAAEQLPPEEVASDAHVARRILGMDAAEVVERLGPHVYTADVGFEWTGPAHPVRLSEQRKIVADRGGVGGDFIASVENSRDQGLEVMRVGGKVYARNRYGKYRQRLRDRGMAERTRSELQGALRDVDSLFGRRMTLAPQGTETVAGRTAWKYTVALAPQAAEPAAGTLELPTLLEPKGGRDATTQRRLRFLDSREPVALEGEVWVDKETSVVLKSRIDGRIRMAAKGEEGPSELRLQVRTATSDIGKAPKLSAPADFLPDADKPRGIADALDRFGIPRGDKAADAGTEPAELPDDE
ncbi:MAG: hypothetical protein L0Y66_04490 [Myxococcaceae bacterium]|nr:hypothetical protein [Myxococcaceae bacterium]MCI0671502.1 hypothetical protein [Myxococcaceae bacterium]